MRESYYSGGGIFYTSACSLTPVVVFDCADEAQGSSYLSAKNVICLHH